MSFTGPSASPNVIEEALEQYLYIYSSTELIDITHYLDYDLVCPREVVDMAIISFLWRPRVDLKYYQTFIDCSVAIQ